ncbi:uncharacterized protein LOC125105551 isoform X1 [Lutra lutra]|uniref:uncharacterized protein LOC125105551 isoform X1 n=1 Tax=Lutra lutra TaxID=9657 RepID=UPI001FD44D69|nr:uncharacterized protein LOC125105551 isoform X1 [Lutra lutra]
MSFTSQALTGAVSTIKFFLSKAFVGQHFEAVELEGKEPEPGDLFLFRLLSPMGRWCRAHVGVYCGRGEIIHFEGRNVTSQGPHAFLGSCEGIVSKQGQRPLQRSGSLWRVLRRRGGVDRAALERRVREAMDADPPLYHPTRSNCVHFALRLLGPGPTLDPLQIDGSPVSSVSAAPLPGHDPTGLLPRLRLHSQLTNTANRKLKIHFTLPDPKHPETKQACQLEVPLL